MGVLLILAQVALVLLDLAAHVVTFNLWVVFLPGILLVAMWALGVLCGANLILDSFTNPYRRVPRARR